MFCHACGINNREEAKFCRKCGTELIKTANSKFSQSKFEKNRAQISATAFINLKQKIQQVRNLDWVKTKLKYIVLGISVLILFLVITFSPQVKAYSSYLKGIKIADKAFISGKYAEAVKDLQEVNQHGLFQSSKSKLNSVLNKYKQVEKDDNNFQQAKQNEQNGDLDSAKQILSGISADDGYPKFSDVDKELNKVNDAINARVQADATAKVAAAQKQVQIEAANKAKAQQAAAEAAANAAANQAAAQAAEAAAAQQAAQAQAAQAQEQAAEQAAAQAAAIAAQQAQAQDTSYIDALEKAETLANSVNTYLNDSASAYGANDLSLAVSDALTAESGCVAATAALPNTYPSKFSAVNSDITNAINDLSLSAQNLLSFEETFNTSYLSSAANYQDYAIAYYNQIKSDLSAIGY